MRLTRKHPSLYSIAVMLRSLAFCAPRQQTLTGSCLFIHIQSNRCSDTEMDTRFLDNVKVQCQGLTPPQVSY